MILVINMPNATINAIFNQISPSKSSSRLPKKPNICLRSSLRCKICSCLRHFKFWTMTFSWKRTAADCLHSPIAVFRPSGFDATKPAKRWVLGIRLGFYSIYLWSLPTNSVMFLSSWRCLVKICSCSCWCWRIQLRYFCLLIGWWSPLKRSLLNLRWIR